MRAAAISKLHDTTKLLELEEVEKVAQRPCWSHGVCVRLAAGVAAADAAVVVASRSSRVAA